MFAETEVQQYLVCSTSEFNRVFHFQDWLGNREETIVIEQSYHNSTDGDSDSSSSGDMTLKQRHKHSRDDELGHHNGGFEGDNKPEV